MKFTIKLDPELLAPLGPNSDIAIEELVDQIFQDTANGVENIQAAIDDGQIIISLDTVHEDAELIKDFLYEGLLVHFDPEYASEVEVEINAEL